MARLLELEAFDMPDPAARPDHLREAEVAELKLAAYEQGYGAGWDDALRAQSEDIARLRTDLGRNLTEMALNYRDARRHILNALEPLLHEMVSKVLPAIARQSLGQVILEQLRPVADTLASVPVVVRVSPTNRELVQTLLARETDLPLRVETEPTLSDGQAHLKLPGEETLVDLDGVAAAIAGAVAAFFHNEQDEAK
jgi:flagellar biosynthesis/type III secretory pathway protein FliH